MQLTEVETVEELRAWAFENMPGAVVELSDEGVVIKTGMDVAMGGYLYPLNEEE